MHVLLEAVLLTDDIHQQNIATYNKNFTFIQLHCETTIVTFYPLFDTHDPG